MEGMEAGFCPRRSGDPKVPLAVGPQAAPGAGKRHVTAVWGQGCFTTTGPSPSPKSRPVPSLQKEGPDARAACSPVRRGQWGDSQQTVREAASLQAGGAREDREAGDTDFSVVRTLRSRASTQMPHFAIYF